MPRYALAGALLTVAFPLAAQPNPFKPPKVGLKGVQVSYALTGDITGTAMSAMTGERAVQRQIGTMKMMGKTSTTDTWSLITPDSTYTADLSKKQGTVSPNLMPAMAKAYDDLDGAGKKRFHQNLQDMGAMLSRAFNLSTLNAGDKLGSRTYAGQECEERKFGPVTVCTMTKAPVMLHSKVGILCFNIEQTATEIKLGEPSGDAFAVPQGITWKPDPHLQKPDSMAQGYVMYLASQQLADSLAKAREQLAAPQAQAGAQPGLGGQPPKMTPQQEAELQKGCEALKNFNLGKTLADATNQMAKEMAEAAKRAAVESAKEVTTNKIKGLIKKPKIP